MIFINEYDIIALDADNSIIINYINGNSDLIENDIAEYILKGSYYELPCEVCEALKGRRYIFNTEEEYLDYIRQVDNKLIDESSCMAPNFVYVPTYNCNLACYYCFEQAYNKNVNTTLNVNSNLDVFFDMVEQVRGKLESKNKIKYRDDEILITLTGGEPLLYDNYHIIEEFLSKCCKKHYTVSIVTNGTTIDRYADMLRKGGACSGRLSIDDVLNGTTICPDFFNILRYVIPLEYTFSSEN